MQTRLNTRRKYLTNKGAWGGVQNDLLDAAKKVFSGELCFGPRVGLDPALYMPLLEEVTDHEGGDTDEKAIKEFKRSVMPSILTDPVASAVVGCVSNFESSVIDTQGESVHTAPDHSRSYARFVHIKNGAKPTYKLTGSVDSAVAVSCFVVDDESLLNIVDTIDAGTYRAHVVVVVLRGTGARAVYRGIQSESSGVQIVKIIEQGKGVSAAIVAGEIAQSNAKQYTSHEIEHVGADGESHIVHNGVCGTNSNVVYRSRITIGENAERAFGSQTASFLTVGDGASISPIPSLDASEEEIRCSHAVSMTRLSGEDLFYALSRGISEEDAKKLMVSGFLQQGLQEGQVDSGYFKSLLLRGAKVFDTANTDNL